MIESCSDLERFVGGGFEVASFPHREHVRMGFEMLRRHDFAETALQYSRTLQLMTTRAGKPEAFHQTVTIAFLSLIAERLESGNYADFDTFAHANPDLFDKSAVTRLYGSERLKADAARRTFLLPVSRE
jgi:hypothetical protein